MYTGAGPSVDKSPSEERFFFFQQAAFSANSSSVRGGALRVFPVQCWMEFGLA